MRRNNACFFIPVADWNEAIDKVIVKYQVSVYKAWISSEKGNSKAIAVEISQDWNWLCLKAMADELKQIFDLEKLIIPHLQTYPRTWGLTVCLSHLDDMTTLLCSWKKGVDEKCGRVSYCGVYQTGENEFVLQAECPEEMKKSEWHSFVTEWLHDSNLRAFWWQIGIREI